MGARLRSSVLAAREHLAEGREQLRQQHDRGLDGVKVCGRFTSLVDGAIQRLYDAALADLPERDAAELRERVTLVAHGGYGRRQQAPYSDVDMMVLHGGKVEGIVADFARRLTQDIFDVGIQLGQSVRTAAQALQMARTEPQIGTSLIESRLLLGSSAEYDNYLTQFKAMVEKNRARLGARIHRRAADGAAAIRRDGVPLGAEFEALTRRHARHPPVALAVVHPLWRGRL